MGANVYHQYLWPGRADKGAVAIDAGGRRGRIVLVSSESGRRGMPATAAYSAVKGAMERWGESMAGEVRRSGSGLQFWWRVPTTLRSSPMRARRTARPRGSLRPSPQHDGQARPLRNEGGCPLPDKLAAGLAKSLESGAPLVRRSVGPDARMLLMANRIMPSVGLHHMIRLMMGIPRFGALRDDRSD